jgi:hypothetical protein
MTSELMCCSGDDRKFVPCLDDRCRGEDLRQSEDLRGTEALQIDEVLRI